MQKWSRFWILQMHEKKLKKLGRFRAGRTSLQIEVLPSDACSGATPLPSFLLTYVEKKWSSTCDCIHSRNLPFTLVAEYRGVEQDFSIVFNRFVLDFSLHSVSGSAIRAGWTATQAVPQQRFWASSYRNIFDDTSITLSSTWCYHPSESVTCAVYRLALLDRDLTTLLEWAVMSRLSELVHLNMTLRFLGILRLL